ncbi:MAG: hypothetical protein HY908_27425 [Myxococcales bacterium]|nr:hypothetical protein [Myxococcales bacterium]
MTRTRILYLLGALVAVPSLFAAAASGCATKNEGTGGTGGATHTTSSTTTTGTGGTGTGGTGTGGDITCGVGAVSATIQDVTQGTVGVGIDVSITGAVVMSQKFVIDGTLSAGQPCLWAVFVSAPGLTTTAPNTGILVLSYGNPATVPDGGTQAYCPLLEQAPAGDAIPDDIQPGDVVDIVGETDYHLLQNCASEPNGSQVEQFQIAKACRFQKTGVATPPTPAVVSASDYATFADQTTAARSFHDDWGGVKVRLANVNATDTGNTGSAVGQYGVITLDEAGMSVGDIYYEGYFAPFQPCKASAVFDVTPGATQNFAFIDGFHHMDYCTWGLSVNDKCSDFSPQSNDCTAASCAPY